MQQTLEGYKTSPDFNRYLLFIMTQMPDEADPTRAVAGIVLKNNIKSM